jgi:(+)-trans-carveol dehydrogenase
MLITVRRNDFMKNLNGKVALISGVARGQGRSHALKLAEQGVGIIGFDILEDIPGAKYPGATEDDLETTIEMVHSVGGKIFAKRADVLSSEQILSVVDEGVSRFGRLDIILANAGIFTFSNYAEDLPEEAFTYMIDVNLNGVWRTIKAGIPYLKSGKSGGSVVITSSAYGLKGVEGYSHYVASKHAVVGLMRSLALELGPEGIRVNTIHPTMVNTRQLDANREEWKDFGYSTHALPTPWVEPEDISDLVVFLCSDESRYITGNTISVDAGLSLR